MSRGFARGNNPHQKKIYGRDNINYRGPKTASDDHQQNTNHSDFLSGEESVRYPVIRKLKEMDSTLLSMELMEHTRLNHPEYYEDTLTALKIASTLHINDFRKSPRSNNQNPPYMEHVLRVAYRPIKYFHHDDPETTIAALLHDTVEDHARDFFRGAYSEEESRDRLLEYYADEFSPEVAETVSRLTNPVVAEGIPKDKKRARYQQHVEEQILSDPDALMVKVSDFIDNAGSLYLTNQKGTSSTQYMVGRYLPLAEKYRDAVNEHYSGDTAESMIERIDKAESTMRTLI